MSLLRAPISALAGRWLSLPPPRCRAVRSDEWVRLRDDVRLPAAVFRPEAETRCTLLFRSIAPIHRERQPLLALARLLAEQGHAVVVAGVRGLQGAEGRFEPFVSDGADAADVLDWIAAEPWSGGPLVLHGFGYAAHAAWATLGQARRPVAGLVAGFGSRDPYAWLHQGGALQLEAGFELALSLAAAEPEGVRRRDLPRALRYRPLREADRVAARRIDWLRDWLAHPDRDDFWQERVADLPQRGPEALLIGGWYHASLSAQLADHAALAAAARASGGPTPRLLIGPWAATALPRRQRDRGTGMLRTTTGALASFLERLVGEPVRGDAPVRAFVPGAGWREGAHWPPDATPWVLHLSGPGRSAAGGRLSQEPVAGAQAPDPYVYDPADAVPCQAGASPAHPGAELGGDGPARGDTLRFVSEELSRPLEIAGAPSVSLHVESSATHTDFTAALLRVRADGSAERVSSGIARVTLRAGAPQPVEIELTPLWRRLSAGDRLRLELSSSCFPRFDRHPNTAGSTADAGDRDGSVARQCIHHDEAHPSRLTLPRSGA